MGNFLESIFGAAKEGLQEVGNAGLDIGKTIAQIPLSVATAVPDFLKNPDLFLNENGQLDYRGVGSLLSKDYRKNRQMEMDTAAQWNNAQKIADGVKFVNEIFQGAATDTAQGEQRKMLEAQGFDPAMLQPLANAAKAERHAARKGATAAGMASPIANIADIQSAQQAGQTRFASDRQLKEIGAQGAETRRNQGNQFGLSKQLEVLKQGNRIAAIDYGNEAEIKKQQNLDAYRKYKAAGDNTRAAAAVAALPEAAPGGPLERYSATYSALAAADPAGAATSKFGEQLESYYTPEQTDTQYQTALVDIARDPAAVAALGPQGQALLMAGIRGEKAAKEVFNWVQQTLKPTTASRKISEVRDEAKDAVETNQMLAGFLPAGLNREMALKARGKGAIKYRDRIIASIDPLNLTDQNRSALLAFMATPAFAKLSPERREYLVSMSRGGESTSEKAVGQIPDFIKPGERTDESNRLFLNGVKADPVLYSSFESKTQKLIDVAEIAGGDAAKQATAAVMKELTGRDGGEDDFAKLSGNEYGRSLLKASAAKKLTLSNLGALDKFRDKTNLFTFSAGPYAAAANFGNRLVGADPSEFTEQRRLLEQASGTLLAQYVQSLSGATVPEAEFERLRLNMPDVNRDGHKMFFAKKDAVQAAADRDLELVNAQIEAVRNGNLDAFIAISDQRGAAVNELNNKLSVMTPPSKEDLEKWTTPEERAGMTQ